MSELSDYLNTHRPDGMSLRHIQKEAERRGHKLNFSTAGRYLAGDHRKPSEEVLQAFAAVFSVDVNILRELSNLGPTGEPFELGPEAAALTGPPRDAIRHLVRVFLDTNQHHHTTTETPRPTQSDFALAAHEAPNQGAAVRDQLDREAEALGFIPNDDEIA